MPALRTASSKPFTKIVVTKGYGFHTPQDGSVCKIKVISDENNIITESDGANEKEFIVGDVDEPIDRIIEDCIRTMKEEEVCCLKFDHPLLTPDYIIPVDSEPVEVAKEGEDPSCKDKNTLSSPVAGDAEDSKDNESAAESTAQPCSAEDSSEGVSQSIPDAEPSQTQTVEECPTNVAEVEFQLLSYTREPEIWEMSVTEKWRRACYHKQRGLELYSRGAYQYAFRRFGLTLKYVISLEHDIPAGQEDGMDIKGLKLSCYLNVAACQMRHHNFESVVINSSKALALQPNNAKALYRRGSAHLQLQEFEKAKEDLTTAQQLEPKNQAVAKQLQLLKCQVQKLNQYYASAMKKLFT